MGGLWFNDRYDCWTGALILTGTNREMTLESVVDISLHYHTTTSMEASLTPVKR